MLYRKGWVAVMCVLWGDSAGPMPGAVICMVGPTLVPQASAPMAGSPPPPAMALPYDQLVLHSAAGCRKAATVRASPPESQPRLCAAYVQPLSQVSTGPTHKHVATLKDDATPCNFLWGCCFKQTVFNQCSTQSFDGAAAPARWPAQQVQHGFTLSLLDLLLFLHV